MATMVTKAAMNNIPVMTAPTIAAMSNPDKSLHEALLVSVEQLGVGLVDKVVNTLSGTVIFSVGNKHGYV